MIPDHVQRLVQKGIQVAVENSAESGAGCPDETCRTLAAEALDKIFR